ncbi:universal stress protein [Gaiella sp.]|jgi:nucleotide-binding universal stress UspA family protein|uniref:universal stress protein n=1 Tax=Gaiella sp. TaxID=2663207 RepID=UPI002D10DBDE|nr:universal stress protein [Gaiella sp.]HWO78924.1 universal stress protein [Gaiella sp.]
MAGVVVAGVDGSDHGREALRFALSEAALRGARVTAVRAWSIPPLTTTGVGIMPAYQVVRDGLAEGTAAELAQSVEEASSEASVEVEVVQGDAAGALVERSAGAALVVVGSRGRGSVAGPLLGSVSQGVLHHAQCPVAVVHKAERALGSRVVVGVDGSPGASGAIQWAFAEAKLRSVPVHAVSAYEEPWTLAAAGFSSAEIALEYRNALAGDAGRVVEEVRAAAPEGVEVTGEVVLASAGRALVDIAGDDLLVVGSRGRGGFKSLLLGSVSLHCAANARGVAVVVREA